MEKYLLGFIIFMVCAVIAVLGFGIYYSYQDSKSPTFTLHKNKWTCTETTSYYTTTNVMVGKVFVPQTTRVTECINYRRNR